MSRAYTVARMTINGENFEILVKPDPALAFRSGKSLSISEVLATETIFEDANKGTRASEKKLKDAFGTPDVQEIARTILKKGSLQLTTEQRKRMVEERRRQIITFLARECVDPRTKLPHPPTRIEQALEQTRFAVDPSEPVEKQANEALKVLRAILPISIEKITVAVTIPPEYASRAYGTVKSYGTIKSENWLGNGSWTAMIEMPAGLYGPLLEKVGEITRGNLEAKIVK